jgi:hypothetical protein
MFNRIVKYFLENRLIAFIFLISFVVMGLVTMPFGIKSGLLPRDPVPVDAIPDIGENQQIVATEWMGRSPKDIQDQVTYPLTSALLGIPGVQTIRSTSMFGMSFIYIIFKDNVEFYWSRSRILEKLNSLPAGTLPAESNLHWDLMLQLLDKSIGIPWKGVILKPEDRLVAGIHRSEDDPIFTLNIAFLQAEGVSSCFCRDLQRISGRS